MVKTLPYKRFVLPNKLTILFYPMKAVLTAFAVLYVRVGAIYEKQNERGVSHFTEHAALLGTKKYPSPLEISQVEENIGARFDGETNRFGTQYWIRLPHTNIDNGIELLHQLVFEPLLNEEAIFKERSVVLSEFNDYWHNPDRRFEHEVWRRRFKQEEHPYSYRAVGIPQTIQQFNKKSVLSWREKYYHPANMVLSIAGNLKDKEVSRVIETKFRKEKKGTKAKEPKFSPNDYSGFSISFQEEVRPQIRFSLTFPAFGWRQFPRRKELEIRLLNHIFGGGPASRLFQRLREKERFVYRTGSAVNLHPWMGVFEIWGSVPIEKLIPAMEAVREEIDKLVKSGVSEQEMRQAKNFLSAWTLMKFDNPESIAYFFASEEFNEEEIWLPEKYIEEAEKIKKGEVNDLAKKIFDYSKFNIGLLGKIPSKTLKELEKIFKN